MPSKTDWFPYILFIYLFHFGSPAAPGPLLAGLSPGRPGCLARLGGLGGLAAWPGGRLGLAGLGAWLAWVPGWPGCLAGLARVSADDGADDDDHVWLCLLAWLIAICSELPFRMKCC